MTMDARVSDGPDIYESSKYVLMHSYYISSLLFHGYSGCLVARSWNPFHESKFNLTRGHFEHHFDVLLHDAQFSENDNTVNQIVDDNIDK